MSATLNFHIETPTEKQPFRAEATHFDSPSEFVSLDLAQGEVSVQLFLRDRKSATLILDAAREAVTMLTSKPSIGVPFASNVLVIGTGTHHWAKQCPECEMAFIEYEEKDEESHTGSEYTQHYIDVHATKSPAD